MAKKSHAVVIAEKNAEANTRASLVAMLPDRIGLNPEAMADEIIGFRDEAQKALAVAERADVNGADPAGKAGDVLRAIVASRGRLDKTRKGHTSVLDKLKSDIKGFYDAADKIYAQADALLRGKIDIWRRAEEDRLTREAEERRKEREAEAAKHAAAQAALGDNEGAQQILEEAAAVTNAPEKVRAVGIYGATVGSTTRNVGFVDDRRAFLKALSQSAEPLMVELADDIIFSQSILNRIAKAVNDGAILPPPGFRAGTQTNSTIR